MPTASFKLLFGQGQWEDAVPMTDGREIKSLMYCYVQIRASYSDDGSGQTIWWTGVVPAEQLVLLGESESGQTADHIVQAYGLEYLLERRIETAWVEDFGDDAGDDAKEICWLPTFNRRHDRGGEILGNRSDIKKYTDGETMSYVFSPLEYQWTNDDIADYLLANCQDSNGPQILFGGSDELHAALAGIVGIHDFSGQTVRAALHSLISRSMGMSWAIYVGDDDRVGLLPFSLLDDDLTIGGVTIPANTALKEPDLWSDPSQGAVNLSRDTAAQFDRIVVRGAKIKSCFTAELDGNLETAWSSGEETAYKAAGDIGRSTDKFNRVYSTFRMKKDWDWKDGADFVVPAFDADGEVMSGSGSAYWNVDKRFLNYLPFKVGIDYSGASAVDKNPADSEPEFLPMIATLQDENGAVRHVERMATAAHVRPLQREFGVEVKFSPNHIAAKNHFSGAAATDKDPLYDYETLLITGFVETDTHIEVATQRASYNSLENRRTLIIDMPECELWYVVPGTICGVDPTTHETIEYGGEPFIRDDRTILRQALAAAAAWYGKSRTKVDISLSRLEVLFQIGDMFSGLSVGQDADSGGSAVTSIRFNFEQQQTFISSDFGEIDAAAMVGRGGGAFGSGGGGTRSTPTVHAAAKRIEKLSNEVRKIKDELGKSPVRIGQSAAGGVTVYRAITTEAAPAAANITCNLYDDTGTEITSGTGSAIEVYCSIIGGTALNAAVPRLEDNDDLFVVSLPYNNGTATENRWYCTSLFQASQDCE